MPRAVVHWRYALVSSHDHTWMPDPKPDGSAGLMNTITSIPMDLQSEKFRGIRVQPAMPYSIRNHSLSHSPGSDPKISSKTDMLQLQIIITIQQTVFVDPPEAAGRLDREIYHSAIQFQIGK